MFFDDLFNNSQPGPRTATIPVLLMQPFKNTEYVLLMLKLNADSIISHMKDRGIGLVVATDFDDPHILVVVFGGIDNQVLQHFADTYGVADKHRQSPSALQVNVVFDQELRQIFDDIIQQAVEINRLGHRA